MSREVAVTEQDRLDSGGAHRVLVRAARLLGPYRRQVAAAAALVVAWTASILAGPFFVRYGIDAGVSAGDGAALNRAVVGFVVVAGASYFVYRAQVLLIGRVGESFLRDLRVRVFDHLQRLSMPFYDRERAGVIVSRMTSDVDALSELVQTGLLMFVMNALLLVLSIIVLAVVSWQLLLVCLVAVPGVVAASIKFQRDSNRAYLEVRDRIGATLSRLQEGISGVRVVQAFGRQELEEQRFAHHNRVLYAAHMDSVFVQSWYLPVIELAGLGTTALVVGVGGMLVIGDVITIGTIAFFVLTLGNLFEPIQQLSQLFNTVQSAGAGLDKLFALLDTPLDVPERQGAVDLPRQGPLELHDVSFAYRDGDPVLQHVSLAVAPGERLALVGPTGAGKSTLAKLAARLYDPIEGRVTFGGVDLRDATLRSLRERIVVVPQEGFLFNGTIRENIRLARAGATDDEVEAALAAVGALDRFASLPGGLDAEVHERGSRLSAGEKQLVSLARVALVDPAVLVLDEATSNLDPGTELVVEEAMARLMEGRTVVVIAHRLSTAARADRVGLVEGGRLVELGRHEELVSAGGSYARLFSTWTGAFTPGTAS
ncbi:ABC transporter ATP-binding protein [Rhabdothermincola sediminis]|uniref:ABC transporter ATP-binding protein n=1 Tax=Rhabdothermincola sediminis TaxID=2751370 RepID=UPI001AA0258E|nr:ABC transporter ATP-binding protein [Rhabdothermincola sediminis]